MRSAAATAGRSKQATAAHASGWEALIERIHLRTLSATSPEIDHERSP